MQIGSIFSENKKFKHYRLNIICSFFSLLILNLLTFNDAFAADDYAAPQAGCTAATINAPSGAATAIGCGASTTSSGTTAVGAFSEANGVIATAIGNNSEATGDAAIAVGASATARGNFATVVGHGADAIGEGATSYGTGSQSAASYATALGYGAYANQSGALAVGRSANARGYQSVAIGINSYTSGSDSIAVGSNASTAGYSNSTAIGANATSNASNQMMLGTSTTTYTAPGITSAASRAAQSGATQYVTTDAQGNLASTSFGPSDITGLQNSVSNLQNGQAILGQTVYSQGVRINSIQKEARQGVAMAAAMSQAPMPSAPGKTSWKLNNAIYKNAAATSLSIAHRLPTKVPVAVTAGVAIGLRNSAIVSGGLQGEF